MENFESLILKRRSTRNFTDRLISTDEVHKILQAALLAPTSKNCKSYEFVVVEDRDMLRRLSGCKNSGCAFLEGCTLAVVVLGDKTVTDIWVEDASIAATYMQLQAEDLNIGSCWCHIRNRRLGETTSSEQIVRDLLDIPGQYGVLCIIGFGYKSRDGKPHDLSGLRWDKMHHGQFPPINKPFMA